MAAKQHSSLGSSVAGNRENREGRLVRVTWSFNCNSYLGFYWPDLRVRCWRLPEAIGFFSNLMNIDFITALTSPSPSLPRRSRYVVLTLAPEHSSRLYKLN